VPAAVTYDQVLAWRLRQQSLVPRTDASAEQVADRLAGVQAQVASAAELAVALRQRRPQAGAVAAALEARTLMKTWTVRGTLHVTADAGVASLGFSSACTGSGAEAVSSPGGRCQLSLGTKSLDLPGG
jgi:hypothetical protein